MNHMWLDGYPELRANSVGEVYYCWRDAWCPEEPKMDNLKFQVNFFKQTAYLRRLCSLKTDLTFSV